MGEILVHEFISLDGNIDDPSWIGEFGWDPHMGEAVETLTARCRGILLGRTTFELFEPAWSTRSEADDPSAPFFNDTMKYVVSGTLTDPTWRNSTVIGAYDAGGIRKLKDEVDGDLYVSGSGRLVRAMLADGLVDELHLCLFPAMRGTGPRAFPDEAAGKLTLTACKSFDNGALYLVYRTSA